jgi:probable F420-dependent oxidoreductase
MQIGALIFPTDRTIRPDVLAPALEQRGYESFWVAEHTHIPLSRRTPYPGGGDLPDMYWRTMDPFVALTAAALSTETIKVGTGICLVNQHHPINAAKQVASIDLLSGGRFLFGVGVGWNEDEMEHHGVTYRGRRGVVREHVLAMKELWSNDVAEFHGDHVDFAPSWSWPKPEVPVPVLIGGGAGPKMFSHLCEYADGWIPIGGAGLGEAVPAYRQALEEAGRDPGSARIVPFGSHPSHEKLDHFEQIGVTECVFRVPSAGRDEVMPVLEAQADLVAARS